MGDDSFHSLFYSRAIANEGRGMPNCGTCDDETRTRMSRVHEDYKFLPKALYGQLCALTVVCCVDVVLQRTRDKKLLLFLRRDAPAAGIWWWPGGRLFKGESFQDCALRKIKEETGGRYRISKVVGIVGVWNTFFPDSAWDADRSPERAGTQTVNVVMMCATDDDETEDSAEETGEVASWAVESQRWVTTEEATTSGLFDKYVRENVAKAEQMGLLLK